jgi:hypothetical protein
MLGVDVSLVLMSTSLVPWQLMHGGCLLAGELASLLRYLMLDVGLLNAGSRSLPLPKSTSSLEMEASV